jgi:hypothetical protein
MSDISQRTLDDAILNAMKARGKTPKRKRPSIDNSNRTRKVRCVQADNPLDKLPSLRSEYIDLQTRSTNKTPTSEVKKNSKKPKKDSPTNTTPTSEVKKNSKKPKKDRDIQMESESKKVKEKKKKGKEKKKDYDKEKKRSSPIFFETEDPERIPTAEEAAPALDHLQKWSRDSMLFRGGLTLISFIADTATALQQSSQMIEAVPGVIGGVTRVVSGRKASNPSRQNSIESIQNT